MTWFRLALINNGFSQLGDFLTTAACIAVVPGHEENPIVAAVLNHFGIPGLAAIKLLYCFLPALILFAPAHKRSTWSRMVFYISFLTWIAVLNNVAVLLLSQR